MNVMRRDLIFKYFSSAIGRLELIRQHLTGEIVNNNNESDVPVIAETSVDLSSQDIEIMHFFLEEVAIRTNQLKALLKLEEDN